MEKKTSIQKIGAIVTGIDFMVYLGVAIGISFASYLMTDIMKIGVTEASSIMSIGNIVCSILVFFVGMMMTNTHTKMGQYRPWLFWTYVMSSVGIILFTVYTGNHKLAVIIAALAFFLYTMGLLIQGTAKFGLYMKLAGDDNEARTLYASRSFTGNSIGSLVAGAVILPLVGLLGKNSETMGWLTTQIIFVIITMTGVLILMKMTKEADTSYIDTEGAIGNVSLMEQLKSLIFNRAALMAFLSDLMRYGGAYFTGYTTAYYFSSVNGNLGLMTVSLTATSIAAIFGTLLGPVATKVLGGRKKTAIIGGFLMAAPLIFAAFSPTSLNWIGFVACFVICSVFSGMVSAVVVPLYTDAGEYWLAEKGVDTRPFLVASQNSAIAIGGGIAGVLVGVFLTKVAYEPGILFAGAEAMTFIRWAGLIPAIAYILFSVCLIIHNLSDEKAEEYIKRNSEAGL